MKKIKLIAILNLLIFSFLQAQTPVLEIWEIQGGGAVSPYENQLVITNQNIVTAVGDDFFCMQTPAYRSDNQPGTSDGIFVFTNNTPTVEIGNMVSVTGYVDEINERTQFNSGSLQVMIDSALVSLPEPILLSENFPSGNANSLPDLEKLEGMYVEINPAITTAPTNQYGETSIKVGTTRSFREPGIAYPGLTGLPVWDDNPEVFEFNPDAVGLPNQEELSAGMLITAKGVINFSFGDYQILPTEYDIQGEVAYQGADFPETTEATVASLNCYVLSNFEPDYQSRLQKLAIYVIEMMKSPDIIAVQEVRSLQVLEDLANRIFILDPNQNYSAHLVSSGQSGSFVIEVGYLVKNTVKDVQITQLGKDEPFSFGGNLHYRPPLLLQGKFNTANPKPITVLNLHLKSLGGITGSNSTEVRTRRYEQSLSVANMVMDYIDENLIVLGDLNAFQFSDGYVDVVNQIAGTPSLGAEYPVEDVVEPPLTNWSLSVPEGEQYSYIFNGHAQILDHCLTTDFQGITIKKLQNIRANADNPESLAFDSATPFRVSDHDGFVLFLDLGDTLSTSLENIFSKNMSVNFPNPFSKKDQISIHLEQADWLGISLTNVEGKIIFQKNSNYFPSGKSLLDFQQNISEGIYFLNLFGKKSQWSGKIFIKN